MTHTLEELQALCDRYGLPVAGDLSAFPVDPLVVRMVPLELARRHNLIPLSRVARVLTVAMADPSNVAAVDALRFATNGLHVDVIATPIDAINEAIARFYGDTIDLALEQGYPGATAEVEVDDAAVELIESFIDADNVSYDIEEQSYGDLPSLTAAALEHVVAHRRSHFEHQAFEISEVVEDVETLYRAALKDIEEGE